MWPSRLSYHDRYLPYFFFGRKLYWSVQLLNPLLVILYFSGDLLTACTGSGIQSTELMGIAVLCTLLSCDLKELVCFLGSISGMGLITYGCAVNCSNDALLLYPIEVSSVMGDCVTSQAKNKHIHSFFFLVLFYGEKNTLDFKFFINLECILYIHLTAILIRICSWF